MKKKRGTVLIVLGVLLLVGALGFAGYNVLDARRAQQQADAVQVQLEEKIEQNKAKKKALLPGQQPLGEEMAVEEIDGRRYIGTIEIPALDKKLPVLEDWSYENLKISPCLAKRSSSQPSTACATATSSRPGKRCSRPRWSA